MNEVTIAKNVVKAIRNRGGWAKKTHGGPQMAGWPDIIFFYRSHGGGIEMKTPQTKDHVTVLQQVTLDEIKAAGCVALVMWSVAQVEKLLDSIDKIEDAKVRRNARTAR